MSDLAQVQAQALHDARRRCERYQRALETIARGETYGPDAFAQAILNGADVADALEGDLAVLTEPLSAEDAAAERRVLARRDVVIAALKETEAEAKYDELYGGPDEPAMLIARMAWREQQRERRKAVAAFRAAGGSEVTG